MIKIYGLVGSNKRNGTSYNLIITLINLIEKIFSSKGLEVTYKIDYVCDLDIKECVGCCNCFKSGECIIDDDMKVIKSNILESDMLVVISPVYLNQISGTLKKVLDRIAYWTHLMPLIGKRGIILANSSFSGTQESIDYLELILNHLGVSVDYNFKYIGKGFDVTEQYFAVDELEHYSEKFLNYDFEVDDRVKELFDNYSLVFGGLISSNKKFEKNNEIKFWKNNYLHKTVEEIYLENTTKLNREVLKNENKK